MSSNFEKKKTHKKFSCPWRCSDYISVRFIYFFVFKVSLLREHFVENLKVIHGNNLHKNIVFWFPFHVSTLPPTFTFSAAGLLLSRPWYWQGWHQRRALTPGELGLPAVSNQVYFEVRDTRTPRAKAATSPALHTPIKIQLTTSEPPRYCRYPAQLYYFQMLQQCIKGPLPKRTPQMMMTPWHKEGESRKHQPHKLRSKTRIEGTTCRIKAANSAVSNRIR